jgi:hypothetical protein
MNVQVSQSAIDRFLIGLLGVVLAVLVVMLVVRTRDGDDEAQVETEPSPTTVSTVAPPTTVTDVLGISETASTTTVPGAEEPPESTSEVAEPARSTDGVEGFITPSNGVADGDLVTISVTGLTPGRNVTATMCWEGEGGFDWMESAGITVMGGCDTSTVAGGGIDVVETGLFDYFLRCMFGGAPGALVDQCDRGVLSGAAPTGKVVGMGRADAQGNAVFTYPITEQLVVADGEAGNCSKGVCSVIVSTPEAGFQCETGGCDAINADLVWIRIPVSFVTSTPSPNAPAVLVASPSIGLDDGQKVDVQATGFTPGSKITVTLCPSDPLTAYGDAYEPGRFADGCPFVLAGPGADTGPIALDRAGEATSSLTVRQPFVDGGPANPCRLSCFLTATDATGRSGQSAVTFSSSG